MPDRYWCGVVPQTDDFEAPITDEFYDAKSRMGPWGFMNPASFSIYGMGVGTGLGQRYKKQTDGRWKKTEG